jgi:hypothetical protein
VLILSVFLGFANHPARHPQNWKVSLHVQDQMGHSSIQVTFDTYGHLFPQSKQESVSKLAATLSAALSSKSLGSEKGCGAGPKRPAKDELLELS